jgi:hypothetical protein
MKSAGGFEVHTKTEGPLFPAAVVAIENQVACQLGGQADSQIIMLSRVRNIKVPDCPS